LLANHVFGAPLKDCKFDAASVNNLRRAFVEQKFVASPPDTSKLYTEAFLPM
jgi:hypothetical protein